MGLTTGETVDDLDDALEMVEMEGHEDDHHHDKPLGKYSVRAGSVASNKSKARANALEDRLQHQLGTTPGTAAGAVAGAAAGARPSLAEPSLDARSITKQIESCT